MTTGWRLLTLLLADAAAVIAAPQEPQAANDTVKIGIPVGLSGAPSVVQAAKLAAAEINAKGGILGKQIELAVADDGSGADGAVKAFNSLIFQQHVNAIITMETSAARNAGLPVVARGKTPFIYTSYYEGHSCSHYVGMTHISFVIDPLSSSWPPRRVTQRPRTVRRA